ncbi:MarR family winged helix-turn-helix transcriptional regulator [Salinimonas lutimaris]|uniref:MarR family winged helix-turn-helix transcriptional regulator n=1 Tax=Salinimonas lutimaris TaxID=914153 RepID=UPI0010BFD904|nr:MarR family transcriptional regulator [Salinimonas lutimaris]
MKLEKNKLDLQRYIPALVNFLSNKLSTGASKCYRKNFDIGIIEWRVLAMLKVESDISANRIGQVIGLDKAAISRAVKQLAEAGYVNLQPSPIDARSSLLQLTEKGHQLHNRILPVALERERLLLSGISEDDLEVTLRVLSRLNENVRLVDAYKPRS